MPSVRDILDALNSSWPVALAAFVASVALLVCDAYEVEYLKGLPASTTSTAFVIAITSAALLVARAAKALVDGIGKRGSARQRALQLADHAAKAWELPDEEKHILAWAVANKQQVLLASFIEPRLQPLVAKGYLQRLSGSHSVLEWPYRIPDHVWLELLQDWQANPYTIDKPNPFQRSLSGW